MFACEDRLLNNTVGDDMIGYDIGCSHSSSVATSSIGERAKLKRMRFIVNAFHGHAHNRLCQLSFHPMYTNGVGLEDFELCERIFASSNAVARLIQHCSHFHWRQFLDLHFTQWDDDRYLELSNFLYNNLRQALSIIKKTDVLLLAWRTQMSFTEEDFERWLIEEKEYLEKLKKPEYDERILAYVESLNSLSKAK